MSMAIRGIQEAQQANLRQVAAVKPNGALGEAVKVGTTLAHRYAVSITHVDSGSLRASQRLSVQGLRGRVYLDPNAVNPRSGARPSIYGNYEHARGGSHAFYERTVEEHGNSIGDAMVQTFIGGLPR